MRVTFKKYCSNRCILVFYTGNIGIFVGQRLNLPNLFKMIFFFLNSAEQLFLSTTQTESEKENTPTKSRSLIFKRKSARRSKSLGKDHWEDVIFCKISMICRIHYLKRVVTMNGRIYQFLKWKFIICHIL